MVISYLLSIFLKNYYVKMRLLKDLFYLFYPKICAVCEQKLVENETTICTLCRHDLPLTNFKDFKQNKVSETFYGRILIEKAFSLLFFRKEGVTKKLIHNLKYKGNEEVGIFFGNWLGEILKENQEFKNINYIIPVPLHPEKLKERGYNQVTKFGETLSKHLNIPFLEKCLVRIIQKNTFFFRDITDGLMVFNHAIN